MLVHTALNKAIRTTFDPYFTNLKYIFNCRAGAPISQTFTLLPAMSSTPSSANYAGSSMWAKRELLSNRGYTNTFTIFRKEQTINGCILTSSHIISTTFHCPV